MVFDRSQHSFLVGLSWSTSRCKPCFAQVTSFPSGSPEILCAAPGNGSALEGCFRTLNFRRLLVLRRLGSWDIPYFVFACFLSPGIRRTYSGCCYLCFDVGYAGYSIDCSDHWYKKVQAIQFLIDDFRMLICALRSTYRPLSVHGMSTFSREWMLLVLDGLLYLLPVIDSQSLQGIRNFVVGHYYYRTFTGELPWTELACRWLLLFALIRFENKKTSVFGRMKTTELCSKHKPPNAANDKDFRLQYVCLHRNCQDRFRLCCMKCRN